MTVTQELYVATETEGNPAQRQKWYQVAQKTKAQRFAEFDAFGQAARTVQGKGLETIRKLPKPTPEQISTIQKLFSAFGGSATAFYDRALFTPLPYDDISDQEKLETVAHMVLGSRQGSTPTLRVALICEYLSRS